jgi:hypothetical protein
MQPFAQLLPVVVFALVARAAALTDAGAKGDLSSLPRAIQRAFGGDQHFNAAGFDPFRKATNPREVTEASRFLAREIERGINLEALYHQHTSGWSVNGRPPPSVLGTLSFRSQLYKVMAEQAEQEAGKPDGDTAVVRAYLAFHAIDPTGPERFLWGSRFLRLREGARIADAAAEEELSSIAKRTHETAGRGLVPTVTLIEALQQMIDAPRGQPIPGDMVKLFEERFRVAWRSEPYATREMATNASLLWRAACLLRARNPGSVAELKTLADGLAEAAPDPLYTRWLNEAVTVNGPEPVDTGAKVIRGPNDLKPR